MSISLVRKELEATLQKAEGYFAQFAEEQEPAPLRLFADELNLARGTFKLLEINGADALVTEMLSLVADASIKVPVKIDSLGHSLVTLSHYINVLVEQERAADELLLPAINQVRKASGHKAYGESHFFKVNLRPKLPTIEKSHLNLKPHLARIRLMYQLGLLRVLRSDDPAVGYKLILRSFDLLEKGFRGSLAWSFWWVNKAALGAMIENQYELTLTRKSMFVRIDQIMRDMVRDGIKIFSSQPANESLKDALYLISLDEANAPITSEVKRSFQIHTDFSEQELKQQRKLLSGPDIGAFDSLSAAITEEIQSLKGALDQAAKGTLEDEGFDELQQKLYSMAGVLKVVNQVHLSERVSKQANDIGNLKALDEQQLLSALAQVADALLQVELASGQFASKVMGSDDAEVIGAGQYQEARIILFDEIQAGISMAKRAIASFVDDGDRLHLANISPSLTGVRGALIFLKEDLAAQILSSSIQFLDEKVLNAQQVAAESHLEVLADALTSVEYYSETVSHGENNPTDILQLAIKSVAQLGYKVS